MGCSFKKACLCYCACSCCVLLAIILAIAVLWSNFEEPTVEVTKAQLSGLTFNTTAVTMFANISIHIKNPNQWPITGSIEEIVANIYSLDAQAVDGRGDAIYMGDATLSDPPVTVEPESETDFVVTASITMRASPETATVAARMSRDCGASSQLVGSSSTKLEVVLAGIVAKVAGLDVDLRGYEIPFSTMVPCQGDASGAATIPAGATSPTTVAPLAAQTLTTLLP
mmetsp:Transcript_53158/g.123611  ORF Transcript_53158/g.123611 Transcript_53158/m.123611 type:complete len:226 (-) Transcript_53158:452-1129(-)